MKSQQFYIGSAWRTAAASLPVIDPSDGQVMAHSARGAAADVDGADVPPDHTLARKISGPVLVAIRVANGRALCLAHQVKSGQVFINNALYGRASLKAAAIRHGA